MAPRAAASFAIPGSEIELHRQVAQFLTLATPSSVVWFHVPNGEYRDRATAGKLATMGVLAGVWDFCVMWNGAPSGQQSMTLWLEAKGPRGRLSPEQREFCRRTHALGHLHEVVRTLEQAVEALQRHRVPTHGRIAA